jgi:hypothetical protein
VIGIPHDESEDYSLETMKTDVLETFATLIFFVMFVLPFFWDVTGNGDVLRDPI